MEWTRLLSTKRQRQNRYKSQKYGDADLRSEFEKDYHRIIGSASFRRLQDKTQVFPLDKSDFIRTRLTHSMEVSSLAKSLGQNIGESILVHKKDSSFTVQMKEDICNILQCAGLIHDIGNPPFGHYGEAAIREWFERNLPLLTYHGTPLEELKRYLKTISDKTLSTNLKELEADKLIVRTEYPQIPPKVEYALSERGKSLMTVLDQLCVWGEENRLTE